MTDTPLRYRAAMAARELAADEGHDDEESVEEAYAVGRSLVERGEGLVDLVTLHHALLAEHAPEALHLPIEAAGELLANALSPAEMALSGYRSTVERLRALNAGLESSVQARTLDLRRAEARYRTLVERLPAITYVNSETRVGSPLYVSEQVLPLLGVTPTEWLDDPDAWLGMVHPDDQEAVLVAISTWEPEAGPLRMTYRMRSRSEEIVWIREEAVRADDPGEGGVIVQGLMLDITEQREMEELYRHAQRMDTVGRLAGGIAHDFNNLLAVIQGHTELALLGIDGDPTDMQEDLETTLHAVETAALLTRQLLAFSRRQVLQPQVVHVPKLLDGLTRMLQRVLGAAIELSLDLGDGTGSVRMDPGQLDQVVVNLCVNARDAMPAGGELRLACAVRSLRPGDVATHPRVQGEFVLITVSDTGTGIPEAVRDQSFEPFFTTKASGRGTGLGLATCAGIVSQSGGFMDVTSVEGEGSVFSVYLPRSVALDPANGDKPQLSPPGGTERVLIVDDEQRVREVAAALLRQLGYTVMTAGSASEAMDVLTSQDTPALLITDTVMPGGNGVELAANVRRLLPELPILQMSGYTEDLPALQDADDRIEFLQKPFSMRRLAEAVRRLIDGT